MAAAPGFDSVRQILAAARRNGRDRLTEPETMAMLELAGIAVARDRVVQSAADAVSAATALGFPVVLKIVSPDLPHKADVGGVRLGLESADAVRRAYDGILSAVHAAAPDARIDGVLVQQQLDGVEVMLGAVRDAQFGPVMVFGIGGTAVEALADVSFRLAPLEDRDARAMLAEVRGGRLLDGFRGAPPASRPHIIDALLRLSALVAHFPDAIREIDVNPMLVTADRAVAVDALAVISS